MPNLASSKGKGSEYFKATELETRYLKFADLVSLHAHLSIVITNIEELFAYLNRLKLEDTGEYSLNVILILKLSIMSKHNTLKRALDSAKSNASRKALKKLKKNKTFNYYQNYFFTVGQIVIEKIKRDLANYSRIKIRKS